MECRDRWVMKLRWIWVSRLDKFNKTNQSNNSNSYFKKLTVLFLNLYNCNYNISKRTLLSFFRMKITNPIIKTNSSRIFWKLIILILRIPILICLKYSITKMITTLTTIVAIIFLIIRIITSIKIIILIVMMYSTLNLIFKTLIRMWFIKISRISVLKIFLMKQVL